MSDRGKAKRAGKVHPQPTSQDAAAEADNENIELQHMPPERSQETAAEPGSSTSRASNEPNRETTNDSSQLGQEVVNPLPEGGSQSGQVEGNPTAGSSQQRAEGAPDQQLLGNRQTEQDDVNTNVCCKMPQWRPDRHSKFSYCVNKNT